MEDLSDKIKKAMSAKKLSVQEIADEIGVSRTSVYDWVNNVSVPRPDKLDKLYKLLGNNMDNEPAHENVSSDLAMTLALKSLDTLQKNHEVTREDWKEVFLGLKSDKVNLEHDKAVMVEEKKELMLAIQRLTAAIGNSAA